LNPSTDSLTGEIIPSQKPDISNSTDIRTPKSDEHQLELLHEPVLMEGDSDINVIESPDTTQNEWVSVPLVAKKTKEKRTYNTVPAIIDINMHHKLLGHVNERYVRMTAKHHGIQLTGHFNTYVECALAKIHMLPISKDQIARSEKPGERIFVDISHFPKPSMANKSYWLLILDDATDMMFSIFLKNKSDSPQHIIAFIQKMQDQGTPVKHIRLDNSGENVSLKDQTQYLNIKYEFTSPNTPQQNGRVERKFAVLYDCVRSMLNSAKLPETLRNKFWAEAANHATDILNGSCTTPNPIPPYRAFYNENPPYYKYLRTFGEITVTSTLVNKKVTGKTSNRGTLALYLGRAQNHLADSYRLLKLDTMRVIISRNVKFTNLTYDAYFNHAETMNNRFEPLSNNDDDHKPDYTLQLSTDPILDLSTEIPTQTETAQQTQQNDTVKSTPVTNPPRTSKLIRELRKLDGF
jgi:hypothetical protein